MKQRKTSLFGIMPCVVPLILGLILYAAIRPDAYVSGFLYRLFGFGPIPLNAQSSFVLFLKNYGGDILWAYAFTSCVILILGQESRQLLLAGLLSFLFEAGIELLQKAQAISGTFDKKDILFELMTTLYVLLITKIKERRRKNKNEEEHPKNDRYSAGHVPVCPDGNGQRLVEQGRRQDERPSGGQ